MDFNQVYQEYFRDVYLYLRSLGANPELAEEITQESFVRAMQSLNQFDGSKDIRAWLFVIARNTLYRALQKSKRHSTLPEEENLTDRQPDIVEQLADRERAQEIHKRLHAMKEPYKEVFTLRVFGELPYEQIGNLFGRSSGWARVTYHRALIKLREEMEG